MRSDDDQWGITESVGVTALGVASGRALETHRDDGLVDDPYAEAFVSAASGEIALPTRAEEGDEFTAQSAYIAVRSRFFDDFFTAAAADGLRQVVLLAAGLDTRAQRLAWPAGTTVYEVDQRGVMEFKDDVLENEGALEAGGGARRVEVRVDLRHDWPAALRDAGFDPAVPTAWLAEGLLPYLPAQAEIDLFDRVQELSAPGSRIAVEHFGAAVREMTDDSAIATMSARFGLDVRDLFYDDPRPDAAERLAGLGWRVEASSATDLAARYGRPLDPGMRDVFGTVRLLDATRTG